MITVNTSTKTTSNADETQSKKLPGRKFYEVDADLRLIRYKGNAYDKLSLTIPKDVKIISSGAIVGDEQVRFGIGVPFIYQRKNQCGGTRAQRDTA